LRAIAEDWRLAAFLRLAAASGRRCRFSTAGEAAPALSGQASPWRESDGVASLQAKA
jgi:hypothetical protein